MANLVEIIESLGEALKQLVEKEDTFLKGLIFIPKVNHVLRTVLRTIRVPDSRRELESLGPLAQPGLSAPLPHG